MVHSAEIREVVGCRGFRLALRLPLLTCRLRLRVVFRVCLRQHDHATGSRALCGPLSRLRPLARGGHQASCRALERDFARLARADRALSKQPTHAPQCVRRLAASSVLSGCACALPEANRTNSTTSCSWLCDEESSTSEA